MNISSQVMEPWLSTPESDLGFEHRVGGQAEFPTQRCILLYCTIQYNTIRGPVAEMSLQRSCQGNNQRSLSLKLHSDFLVDGSAIHLAGSKSRPGTSLGEGTIGTIQQYNRYLTSSCKNIPHTPFLTKIRPKIPTLQNTQVRD